MHFLVVSTVIVSVCFTVDAFQLSCDNPLRYFPSLSYLFAHCECSRGEWTEWATVGRTNASACPSGKALIEERRQRVLTGNCNDTVQRNATCEPTVEERLILALGLGSSGQRITPTDDLTPKPRRSAPNILRNEPLERRESVRNPYCEPTQVCQATGHKQRRAQPEIKQFQFHVNKHASIAELEPEPDNPIPFDMLKHAHRYRREHYDRKCSVAQYVLFVLDTSASIEISEFENMTTALSCLVPHFCNPINIAVMTFDDHYFMEFCFDCFDNTCEGRKKAADAVGAINHRYKGFTHTGGAVRCVEELLTNQQICNFNMDEDPYRDIRCIDIVFITDGHSNGPLDMCEEMDKSRLKSDQKIKVHAIGIGDDHNMEEIQCLSAGSAHGESLFFPTFKSFTDVLNNVVQLLQLEHVPPGESNPLTCIITEDPLLDTVNKEVCQTDACNKI